MDQHGGDPEPVDVLGAAALPVERLRRFVRGEMTAAERAEARRVVDELADRMPTIRARRP
jgi:hypothetical protein